MKHKVAVLSINSLEGEIFKNYIEENPINNVDFFYFQDNETTFASSSEGASIVIEEKEEYLLDFPIIIDFKKERKRELSLEGLILNAGSLKIKDRFIFYGINHKELKNNKRWDIPHPISCLLLRFFLGFKGLNLDYLFGNFILSTSEEGREGQDELYNQTIALLNIQSFEKKVYKNQIAFSLNFIFDEILHKNIEKELNYFFKEPYPLHLQFIKGGIFFGVLIFLNIIFKTKKDKEAYLIWLNKIGGFNFNSKEGLVEAVQRGEIFINLEKEMEEKVLSLKIFADPLYSGLAYNLSNLVKEFYTLG